jgi:hypothetical protein
MSTIESRVSFQRTNKKLRRARKLYSYIIFETCIGEPHMVVKAARRAQSAGLYAPSTILSDVIYSIIKYLKKVDMAANPNFYRRNPIHDNWMEYNFNLDCEGDSRIWVGRY